MNIVKVVLGCLVLGSGAVGGVVGAQDAPAKASQVVTADSYRTVARKVSPSVVNIRIKRGVANAMGNRVRGAQRPQLILPPGIPEAFRQQFEQMFDQNLQMNVAPQVAPGAVRQEQYVGAGSGVLVREDGYIVTSFHVVANCTADNIEVTLSDGTKFPRAEIVGADELTDLAVLKIASDKPLPAASWGNSDELEPGDIVVAIGNSLDYANTISEGIVSAKHRTIKKAAIEDLIQTTAMINPGNSGGALCDLDGKVVGINMAIATDTGLWSGVGFTIPSSLAKNVTDQIIDKGTVSRGYLGIEMEPLTADLAMQLGHNRADGVVVRAVANGSPAAKAGIERYDIIAKIDERDIGDPQDLLSRVGSKNTGDSVEVEVLRNKGGTMQTMKFTVVLAERPDAKAPPQARGTKSGATAPVPATDNMRGLQVAPEAGGGVKVTAVAQGSSAAHAGIEKGDKILEVNKQPVTDADSLSKAFDSNTAVDTHLMYIERNGQSIFAQISAK